MTEPDATATRGRGHWLSGSLLIAVAMGVMNVANYAFTIVAARVLGPVSYGALAAVMGLLLVVNVLALGLQATGARRISAEPERSDAIAAEVMRTTYRCAAGLGLLVLLVSPLVSALLDLGSWQLAALIGVTALPLTLMGGQAGVLQGERRWGPLAGLYLAAGLGRLGFGGAALAVDADSVAAMTGVLLGATAPVVVGWWALRGRPAVPTGHASRPSARSTLRETMHNSHALLAFFALSSVDVVVARVVLDEHRAGLYAAGLILAKAVLFLPQFVVVIVFPAMSSPQSARRLNLLSLALVLAMGLVVVAGVAGLPDLALAFVGGPEYAEIAGRLWLFAVLGTLLSLLQLLVYNVLARQRQRAVLVIWAAIVVVVAVSAFTDTVTGLVTVVLAVDALVFLALLAGAARGTSGGPARA